MRSAEVTRYTYHLFSSRDEDAVVVFLYDDTNDVVGEAFFVGDGGPLPPATNVGGRVALYFRRSQLPSVLDLLRNEGPIQLRWGGAFDTSLSTEYEPIGEGEAPAPAARLHRTG